MSLGIEQEHEDEESVDPCSKLMSLIHNELNWSFARATDGVAGKAQTRTPTKPKRPRAQALQRGPRETDGSLEVQLEDKSNPECPRG